MIVNEPCPQAMHSPWAQSVYCHRSMVLCFKGSLTSHIPFVSAKGVACKTTLRAGCMRSTVNGSYSCKDDAPAWLGCLGTFLGA